VSKVKATKPRESAEEDQVELPQSGKKGKKRTDTESAAANPWLDGETEVADKKAEKKLKKMEQSRTINLDMDAVENLVAQSTRKKGSEESDFNLVASASDAQKEVRILTVFM